MLVMMMLASSPIGFALLQTGHNESPEAAIFEGGELFKRHRSEHTAVLVHHGDTFFLFDTGLATTVDAQFMTMPWYARTLLAYEKETPVVTQLRAAGMQPSDIAFIVLSHMHWDHVSAIADFPNPEVWTTKAERENAWSPTHSQSAFLEVQYKGVPARWHDVEFEDGPYETFTASTDVFHDGSVVLVPMPGHTPGSLAMFLNVSPAERFLFVGDTVWSLEQVWRRKDKQRIARMLVDDDPEAVHAMIEKLHQLTILQPELRIVPAHDFDAQRGLARFPSFTSTHP